MNRLRTWSKAYRTSRGWEIEFNGMTYKVPGEPGYGDVFRIAGSRYFAVLSYNTSLPYVGLRVYELGAKSRPELDWEIFAQEWQVEEYLGSQGTDLLPVTMAKRLLQWWQ